MGCSVYDIWPERLFIFIFAFKIYFTVYFLLVLLDFSLTVKAASHKCVTLGLGKSWKGGVVLFKSNCIIL